MRFFELRVAFASLLAIPFAFAAVACVEASGTFSADGYRNAEFPYGVRYAQPTAKDFLGPDWRIDNYYLQDDGTIGSPKTTSEYVGTEAVDLRGDGRLTRWRANYFDLKLDNRKTSGVIWVQHIQLGRNDADRNLRNLFDDYAEALSGSGFFAAVRNGQIRAKTYAAKIVEGKDTTLGGHPAYDVRLELANLDQVRLDPSARTALIRVVLIKTDYVYHWTSATTTEVPMDSHVLLRVGYSARPSDFDAGLPDFERFLTLLQFDALKADAGPPPEPTTNGF
jgi:hypothetical protein